MRVAVIGGGSWGTALAVHLAGCGHHVRIWAYEDEVVEDINRNHENTVFLKGAKIPEEVFAYSDFPSILDDTELLLSVVPSQFVRSVVKKMAKHVPPNALIVSATKGIENETLSRVTEIYKEELGDRGNNRICVLCGPSFATEVVKRMPTAVVAASENIEDAVEVQKAFSNDYFRVYSDDDVLGVEICGAVKNVIALASGAVTGLGLGDNTKAALITRGLAEISRLVTIMGGKRRTVAGLAGVGDMVLTCTSTTSRNFSVGVRLGEGESLEEITSSMKMIAEGVRTTKSVSSLAQRYGVEMPISQAMYSILYEGLPPQEAVRQLMTRDLKQEWNL